MPRVIHFEIHAVHPERAVKFYSEVFGWKFQAWDGPSEYWMIETGNSNSPGINGGLLRRRGPAPAHGQAVNAFVCTLDVASVDDTIVRASGAGGSVAVPKMAVPGVGWLVYFKDPEGNIFGAMQADRGAK